MRQVGVKAQGRKIEKPANSLQRQVLNPKSPSALFWLPASLLLPRTSVILSQISPPTKFPQLCLVHEVPILLPSVTNTLLMWLWLHRPGVLSGLTKEPQSFPGAVTCRQETPRGFSFSLPHSACNHEAATMEPLVMTSIKLV